jgi:hypothetical protein
MLAQHKEDIMSIVYIGNVGPTGHFNHTQASFRQAGHACGWIKAQLAKNPTWHGVSIACDDAGFTFGRRYVSWASDTEGLLPGQGFCNVVNRQHYDAQSLTA